MWLDSMISAIRQDQHLDPSRGKITVAEWSAIWFAGQAHLKPSTRHRYAGILKRHVLPRWKDVQLVKITHSAVQAWVVGLPSTLSPSTVRKIHRVLSLMLDGAVADRRIHRNPAANVKLPRIVRRTYRYLSHDQVDALALACATPPPDRSKYGPNPENWNPDYRLVVLFLAYTGCRWGEMAALRVENLNLTRRRAAIVESVSLIQGVATWGTPKNNERREVPLPEFLAAELKAHIANKQPDDLVFTGTYGGPLRSQVFQRAVLTQAAASLGLDGFHPHELRHTAASLAIAAGADVKVVQHMLGHKSATMTLDLYGHLFDDRLNEVAAALDAARKGRKSSR